MQDCTRVVQAVKVVFRLASSLDKSLKNDGLEVGMVCMGSGGFMGHWKPHGIKLEGASR